MEFLNVDKIIFSANDDKVLSLNLTEQIGKLNQEENNEVSAELEEFILSKIEERKLAKQNKDYALADSIRSELAEKGVEIIDTPQGTTFKIKK